MRRTKFPFVIPLGNTEKSKIIKLNLVENTESNVKDGIVAAMAAYRREIIVRRKYLEILLTADKPNRNGFNAIAYRDLSKSEKNIFITVAGLEKTSLFEMIIDYYDGRINFYGGISPQVISFIYFLWQVWDKYGKPSAVYAHSGGTALAAYAGGLYQIPLGLFESWGQKPTLVRSISNLSYELCSEFSSIGLTIEQVSENLKESIMFQVFGGVNLLNTNGVFVNEKNFLFHNKIKSAPSNIMKIRDYHDITGPTHRFSKIWKLICSSKLEPRSYTDDSSSFWAHIKKWPTTAEEAIHSIVTQPIYGQYLEIPDQHKKDLFFFLRTFQRWHNIEEVDSSKYLELDMVDADGRPSKKLEIPIIDYKLLNLKTPIADMISMLR